MFFKISVLKNFARFTGKNLCWSPFFNKIAGLHACNIKKRLQHSCFAVNIAKFLKTLINRIPPVAASVRGKLHNHLHENVFEY